MNAVILIELAWTPAGNSLLFGMATAGITYLGFLLMWRSHFFPAAQKIGSVEDFTELSS
jgi:hypothetical protein